MTTYTTQFINQTSYADSGGSAGRLYAVLISHEETTPQTVIFYDDTAASGADILAAITVTATTTPAFINFTEVLGAKLSGLAFTTGLSIAAGDCFVTIWKLTTG